MIYRMKLADSVDEMTFDLLEVPIEDKDIEGATDNTTIDGNIFTDYLWLKKQFVQKWSLMCKDDYTQLRGFYTRQWENAEAPTYTLFAGQNRSETLTASGSAFRIQNGAQYDAPLTLTELKGNATQNGTPTPDAPVAVNTTTGENVVKITGKNLFNPAVYASVQGNNARRTLGNDGSITWVNTTSDSYFPWIFSDSMFGADTIRSATIPVKPSTQYTVSLKKTTATATGLYIYEGDSDYVGIKNTYTTIRGDASYTFTTSETTRYVILRFAKWASQETDVLSEIQLEAGTTATSYEPYQGQDYEVNLGKNLLNHADIVQGTWINQSVPSTCTFFLPIYTGQTITVSNQDTATWRFSMGLCETPHAGTNTQDTGWQTSTSKSLTAQSDGYLYVQLRKNDVSNITPSSIPDDVYMVERGSTATTYAPYFTPIELAKIGNYQDRIYKTDGKWYLEKQTGKYIFDGSSDETWTLSAYTLFSDKLRDYATAGNTPMTQYFVGMGNVSGAGAVKEGCIAFNNSYDWYRFYVRDSSKFSTAESFKTWLAEHPMTVYYALATPTTTEITNETLLAQLNFIANLYGGTNNIMLVGAGAQGEIGVEYTLTYEKEQTIIPETTVRLTLTDGGVINTCECRQNVQLTMRETVQ